MRVRARVCVFLCVYIYMWCFVLFFLLSDVKLICKLELIRHSDHSFIRFLFFRSLNVDNYSSSIFYHRQHISSWNFAGRFGFIRLCFAVFYLFVTIPTVLSLVFLPFLIFPANMSENLTQMHGLFLAFTVVLRNLTAEN